MQKACTIDELEEYKQSTANTMTCADGEEEMATIRGDELVRDGVGGGDFPNEDDTTADTMTCADGEEEMAMMGGDELFWDGVGVGDFMNEDDTSKTGDDEGNKANNIIPSMCSDNDDKHSDIGNCPRRSVRIKAKLDKLGDECTVVESLYPEPHSKFPKK